MSKEKRLTIVGIITLLLLLIGSTYAFFRAQGGNTTSQDVSVTSNTTDNLSFQISNDISFRVSQSDLAEGGNNKSGNATATAIFTPNNKTGSGSMNYYLYLNLTQNGIVYSSTNTSNQPELMVTVYDSNNQVVSLSGLGEQKTVKGVTGYDITGRLGLIPLLDNHEIIANNNTVTTEIWQVVVTLINLDVDQQDNTNKEILGELIISKDQQLDSPRLAITVPQKTGNVTKGYVDTVIDSSINNDEEIYTIYTVGYITDATISGTTYSIDIKNLDFDLSKYGLELVGTPEVMTTEADYTNYVTMKNSSVPLTSLSNGDTNSAQATANELYTYSLNASELTINGVSISCNSTRCTATISESFSNISGKSKHSTTNSNNEVINVLYNGIKFNLKKIQNVTKLANGYLYYHNETLENGANDGSYRYAGANPNNYICFGSYDNPCPSANLYRIIGQIPVDVVISGTNTESQLLYKLIKNNYLTSSEVSTGTGTYNDEAITTYTGPSGNQASIPQGYYWSGSSSNSSNTWSSSTFNTTGLNSQFLGSLGSAWQNRIANVAWKVGGADNDYIRNTIPMSAVYINEITASGQHVTNTPTDGKSTYLAKVGLMYASDFAYSTLQNKWNVKLGVYDSTININNWLYRGVSEWLITRYGNSASSYRVDRNGGVSNWAVNEKLLGARPVFYLNKNTVIDMENYTGTKTNPYRITLSNNYKKVTFNLNGGSGLKSTYVLSGEKVSRPTDPTKLGYALSEWQLNGQTYNYNSNVTSDITLDAVWVQVGTVSGNGYLYHHDSNLPYGANDGSYRYAGANPNNWICFGSDATVCPDNNLYRIIGQIPVDVVVSGTTTQSQSLYKLIKNDYLTSSEVSTGSGTYNDDAITTYTGPSGNQVNNLQGYYWSGSKSNSSNTWSSSTFNTSGLNSQFLGSLGSAWQNKIANVAWKVGGVDIDYFWNIVPMRAVYINEISESGQHASNAPTDGKSTYLAKIGLMYASDFAYSTLQTKWNEKLSNYNSSTNSNNWLYRGVSEWLITRVGNTASSYRVDKNGGVSYWTITEKLFGTRPVFYLTQNTTIDMNNHEGTKTDPYRIQ